MGVCLCVCVCVCVCVRVRACALVHKNSYSLICCVVSAFQRGVKFSFFWDVSQRLFVISYQRLGEKNIGPILTLEDRKDRLSQNVGN